MIAGKQRSTNPSANNYL